MMFNCYYSLWIFYVRFPYQIYSPFVLYCHQLHIGLATQSCRGVGGAVAPLLFLVPTLPKDRDTLIEPVTLIKHIE